MHPPFLSLSETDKAEALAFAADQTGRPMHLLEKDAWVVWTLKTLFEAPFGNKLVFKGGTSLSKAYKIINRFSEDIDLTYNVTALIPELANNADGLPANRSQANKWTKEIHQRLPEWVSESALPTIRKALQDEGLTAETTVDGDSLIISYPPASSGSGYVKPIVLAEFGARSTGEPSKEIGINCDAALALPMLAFPSTTVRAMTPERTFWEKATAVHVYCVGGRNRGRPAFARHWHDLARLHNAGTARSAIADKSLAAAVAQHKTLFFREPGPDGTAIDYNLAVNGALNLIPEGDRLDELQKDYEAMVADGLLLNDASTFEKLLSIIKEVETIANSANKTTSAT